LLKKIEIQGRSETRKILLERTPNNEKKGTTKKKKKKKKRAHPTKRFTIKATGHTHIKQGATGSLGCGENCKLAITLVKTR